MEKTKETKDWYFKNWGLFNRVLTNIANTKVKLVYISNFEFVPESVDQQELIRIFNADTQNWYMTMTHGIDSELVIYRK